MPTQQPTAPPSPPTDTVKSQVKNNQEEVAVFKLPIQNELVRMQVLVGQEPIGSLVFEACENFIKLALGSATNHKGKKLSYAGSLFHRIVPNGFVQGGDVHGKCGSGGESIYGDCFEDESFAHGHSQRGTLSMANSGPHTNASQFFITLKPLPSFDCLYVVFGRLVGGEETLGRMESLELVYPDYPKQQCLIGESEMISTQ